MKFKTDDLVEMYNGAKGDFRIISRTIVGHSRWSVNNEIIFQYNDKFYKTYYSSGATEYQESYGFGHDEETECEEVIPVEVKVIKYLTLAEATKELAKETKI